MPIGSVYFIASCNCMLTICINIYTTTLQMKKTNFIKLTKVMLQKDIANKLKCHPAQVSQWKHGYAPIPAKYIKKLEKLCEAATRRG